MARWLVTQGDRQFSAQDLNELKQLAAQGRIGPGDMVQPPGASDWLYASELPELKGALRSSRDDDDAPARRGGGLSARIPLIIGLIALSLGGVYAMYHFYQQVPKPGELDLLGEGGMALTEMLVVTDNATVRSGPEASASEIGTLSKDAKVHLLAKRGDFYQVRQEGGQEGWVSIKEVFPAYRFAPDPETREDYDPIYNPDQYVFVKNSSWMMLPPEETRDKQSNITVFQFVLQNKSKFEMTDIKLLTTIKDQSERTVESKEIAVEGGISPYDTVEVGTLSPPEDAPRGAPGETRLMTSKLYNEMLREDPTLEGRWRVGIEVPMESEGIESANVELLEVRAVPRKLE